MNEKGWQTGTKTLCNHNLLLLAGKEINYCKIAKKICSYVVQNTLKQLEIFPKVYSLNMLLVVKLLCFVFILQ